MPGLIDTEFSAWLKAPALYASLANAALPAGLQAAAREQEIISGLATKAGADAELARQMAFLGGPLARDIAEVPGAQAGLIGRAITLTCDLLGYDAGKLVFVVGAKERDDGITELTVLRKLT